MGANPIRYLVVPRFLACFFLIPTLTIMADFMGVAGGHFYSVNVLGIDIHHYWHNSAKFVSNFDLFVGLFKSIFFGSAIAMISCYQGFNCQPGAEGVGRASTAAFRLFIRRDSGPGSVSGNHAGLDLLHNVSRRSVVDLMIEELLEQQDVTRQRRRISMCNSVNNRFCGTST